MDEVSPLKQLARYIDSKLSELADIAETGQYESPEPNEDEDLLLSIRQGIELHRADVQAVKIQVDHLEDLTALIRDTKSAIDELKRYGALCGLPLFAEDRRSIERKRSPASSPSVPRAVTPTKLPLTTGDVTFREITEAEYRTLPSIVPLLVKHEDMNKHYCTLIESGMVKFSPDDLSETIPLSNSRLNAFTRALVSLGRLLSCDDDFYHLV
jgi:hypothetical protein